MEKILAGVVHKETRHIPPGLKSVVRASPVSMRNCWIVIPAYRASETIERVVQGLKSQGYENIVVVDDGSTDSTFAVAGRLPVHILRHLVNRGQGAALQTGITYALSKNPECIVMFDSDGQHRPEDVAAVCKPVIDGTADIALGSRFLSRCDVPPIRMLALKCGAFLIYLFHGLWLTDSHNGLRCISASASRELEITSDRMEHASEIIEIIKNKGWRFVEVPVIIHYSKDSLRRGQSTLAAFRILGKMFWRKFSK